MENQTTPDSNADMPVVIRMTVGEINGIFGAINASPFRSVSQAMAQDVSNQISSQVTIQRQTQQEVLDTIVDVSLKVSEVNTIISIVNSTGFATIMKPTFDKITQQIQLQVSAPAQNQQTQNLTPLPQMNIAN